MLGNGMITENDLSLFTHAHGVTEAADAICDFYKNYDSQRYIDGTLVLRMQRSPDDALLERLNTEFADIIVSGNIERVPASAAEITDNDVPDLARIAFEFNRRHFGRLRQLVDQLNGV